MTSTDDNVPSRTQRPETTEHGHRHDVVVQDQDFASRSVALTPSQTTGESLIHALGYHPATDFIVLRYRSDGALEDIGLEQPFDLDEPPQNRFFVIQASESFNLVIDGVRRTWVAKHVSGLVVRRLGHVPNDRDLVLLHRDGTSVVIGEHDQVDLSAPGVETFLTRKKVWKLNVHGVTIDVLTPDIKVADAMSQAGFDTTQPWHMFFKVHGQPKREVELTTLLDLTTPGIEKLRLMPKNVDNGEGPPPPRRKFSLLDIDTAYLDRLGLRWETIIEQDRRWLLIHQYPVPAGYTMNHVKLALEIPPTYPAGALYGFYAHPPLALTSGREIPSTQVRGTVLDLEFHGWSRHRGAAAPWNPAVDNIVSQLALVEAALAKEIGE